MKLWFLCFALFPLAIAIAPGPPSEYHDVLGSGKREWRLAFRGSAGAGTSMYDAYRHRVATAAPKSCTNWKKPCSSHYRNDDALENWSHIDRILLGVVQGGVIVKTITFDGAKSNYMNWMHKERYIACCWEDLHHNNTNFFSIDGHAQINRRFFINSKYGGCPNDFGWLVVVDTPTPPCPWEKRVAPGQKFKYPQIKYSPQPTFTNWNSGNPINADAIVVFLKYLPDGGSQYEYHDVLGTGRKEWRLAFRGAADIRQSVYEAYQDRSNTPRHVGLGCRNANWRSYCSSHYRNADALENWKNVKEVMLAIVDNGVLVKTAIFDGVGTDNMSWFSGKRLISSCWDDLDTKRKNFFSIAGDARHKRRFFISHKYARCPGDMLWMAVVDGPKPPCGWEKSSSWPSFLYAAGPTVQNANSPVKIRRADGIAVFIKYFK